MSDEEKYYHPITGSSVAGVSDFDPVALRGLPRQNFPFPVPPKNLKAVHLKEYGRIDLSWDSPLIDPRNSEHEVIGCHVYRSVDSSEGPYTRLTETPCSVNFYRDQSENINILGELVSAENLHISDTEVYIQTAHYPLVSTEIVNDYEYNPDNIVVDVDGVRVRAKSINPLLGKIELYCIPEYDPVSQRYFDLHLPKEGSEVKVSYVYNKSFLQRNYDLDQRIFYKVTSISAEGKESPLETAYQTSYSDLEGISYVWANIISKQNFLLDNTGERGWLFIQKSVGVRCDCISEEDEALYGENYSSNCKKCYGTGFTGGYIGPIEVMMAPFDAETTYKFSNKGRVVDKNHETFLTNYPVVRQGDILVRQNNERFVIGPVKRKEPNGVLIQQNFTVALLQPRDIRYRLGITKEPSFDVSYIDKQKEDKRYLETKGKTPRFRNIHRLPEKGLE